jgi:hypothetical protein
MGSNASSNREGSSSHEANETDSADVDIRLREPSPPETSGETGDGSPSEDIGTNNKKAWAWRWRGDSCVDEGGHQEWGEHFFAIQAGIEHNGKTCQA